MKNLLALKKARARILELQQSLQRQRRLNEILLDQIVSKNSRAEVPQCH